MRTTLDCAFKTNVGFCARLRCGAPPGVTAACCCVEAAPAGDWACCAEAETGAKTRLNAARTASARRTVTHDGMVFPARLRAEFSSRFFIVPMLDLVPRRARRCVV